VNEPDPLRRCDAWSMPARNPRTHHTCPGKKQWFDNCYPLSVPPIDRRIRNSKHEIRFKTKTSSGVSYSFGH
jgi:hypothetical protein